MLIGEVASQAGLSASTLRYYEREGLLPSPARSSKRRMYDPQVIGRIRIVQLARSAGFSISETRTFVGKYPGGSIPSTRWRAMADRKMQEIDALIAKATQMKTLLRSSFKCGCTTIADCVSCSRAIHQFVQHEKVQSVDRPNDAIHVGRRYAEAFADDDPWHSAVCRSGQRLPGVNFARRCRQLFPNQAQRIAPQK
jgi:MerR family transcriptional regulator, redox-sensitive transcriptional activator SoxR